MSLVEILGYFTTMTAGKFKIFAAFFPSPIFISLEN
jgi:hypothetical protein